MPVAIPVTPSAQVLAEVAKSVVTPPTTLGTLMTNIGSMPLMELLLFGALTFIILVLIYIQTRKDSLDLRWLILDETSQRPSLNKIGQGLALIVSTWGFLVLVERNLLTEFYFTGYMTVWAGSTALSQYLASRSPSSSTRTESSSTTRVEKAQ